MDSVFQTSSFMYSTVDSDEIHSQYKGNSTEEQERFCPPKWTEVLLIVSLFFALGGLCALSILYVSVSVKLSAQETNVTIMVRETEELRANYTRVTEDLRINDIMVRELAANYSIVGEQLSFYEAFTAQSLNCDMSLTSFHGKLYFFSSNKMDWSSSRAFCVSKGADLVTITSLTEQLFLASKIKDTYWIGLNDLDTEGLWVWVNNQTLNETGVLFWHGRDSEISEPDNWKKLDLTGENCALVNNNFNYLNNWFDSSCNSKWKFICEKK
ncbi:C-type lectin domain family 4 member E-like [Sinocyclocheilus rhinocerous]|uniref:C-type lectin domain family 4 member E-like n=1 Tax=Sinocyclocheilus rhinocerous TaxID=307959 RepID=UPI0007B790F9|nr:PREDICTED: C-type lectin domain family 4 member E-like [Sinocyclocheilus rhinocerous]XP_016406375.1 PREDICTED: C-type lectin domain family 4 member E-like [Sinocyclocheilus rhinocerous]XP_016406376.1 PREDICTED: C-type lectin domain family 4 member E-like [Sinocyclocheilus rhinocerous]